jgi:hypothetical protein
MKTSRFLFIFFLLLAISCTPDDYPSFVTVINNSEHNITLIVVVDTKTDYHVINEKGNKLIEKGTSKTFEIRIGELPNDFIVCVEAEDISELMCTVKFTLNQDNKIFFTWGGENPSIWQPKR